MFHGTDMRIRLSTEEAFGAYAIIEMKHPPEVGPGLHVHPTHPESFLVLEGEYTFYLDEKPLRVGPGAAVAVPAGTAHRYKSGPAGGRVIVISPPHLEKYFTTVADLAQNREVTLSEEAAIASRYGQHFLDLSGHW